MVFREFTKCHAIAMSFSDDAIDVALNDMDGAALSPNGDPTHMDVPT